MFNIRHQILDILFPKFCVGCGKEGEYLCKNCEIFLSEVDIWNVQRSTIVSMWEYEGLMEKLIHEIKFKGKYHIIEELVKKVLEKIEFRLPLHTVITYVPMFKKQERERGFNQSELIARKLELWLFQKNSWRPKVVTLLKKIKDSRSQKGLGFKERIENVKGVFVPAYSMSNIEHVLLVDDVYTSGATAKECVKILKKAGVKNVWVFTLSRKMSIQNY